MAHVFHLLHEHHADKHPKAAALGSLAFTLAATTVLFAIVVVGIFVALLMTTVR